MGTGSLPNLSEGVFCVCLRVSVCCIVFEELNVIDRDVSTERFGENKTIWGEMVSYIQFMVNSIQDETTG